jgi:hypothetical protein
MAATTTTTAQARDGRVRSAIPTPARRTFTEAKNGFKTSEFYLTLLAIAGILLATYADGDTLSRADGWRYVAFVAMAYIVSRGLAKLGTREPYTDDRDD